MLVIIEHIHKQQKKAKKKGSDIVKKGVKGLLDILK